MDAYTYLTRLNTTVADDDTDVVPLPDHLDQRTRLAAGADAEAPAGLSLASVPSRTSTVGRNRTILKATAGSESRQEDASSRRLKRSVRYCPYVAVREFEVQEGHRILNTRARMEFRRQKRREEKEEQQRVRDKMAEIRNDLRRAAEEAKERMERRRAKEETNTIDHLCQRLKIEYDGVNETLVIEDVAVKDVAVGGEKQEEAKAAAGAPGYVMITFDDMNKELIIDNI